MDEHSVHWEAWNPVPHALTRQDRIPIMHPVVFERTPSGIILEGTILHNRLGLSLNISSAGLCLLVNDLPSVGEVWRVLVPSSAVGIRTPTLADVRWARRLPLAQDEVFVVGLKFIL